MTAIRHVTAEGRQPPDGQKSCGSAFILEPTVDLQIPFMAHVPAGKQGEIIWTFNRSGEFDFACLLPGHYEAGMVGKIKVVGAGNKATAGR
jgi:uncharacterized cupredoxin-like copper-binding protein